MWWSIGHSEQTGKGLERERKRERESITNESTAKEEPVIPRGGRPIHEIRAGSDHGYYALALHSSEKLPMR